MREREIHIEHFCSSQCTTGSVALCILHGNCCNCKDGACSISAFDFFLYPYIAYVRLSICHSRLVRMRREVFISICAGLIVLSARLLLLFHMCRLVPIDHLRISLPRCSIVLVVAVAASNGTKIGIVCIIFFFEYKRPGSYFVRIPLLYANTSNAHERSWFEAMAFCGRQPVDVVNGKGEMDF